MFRAHSILPAIVFTFCVMLGSAEAAPPEFFLCDSACTTSCEASTLPDFYEGTSATVTRKLCLTMDTDLCGWQLELRGFDAQGDSDNPDETTIITDFDDATGDLPGELVWTPDATPGPSLSLNWVNEGSSLAATTEVGEITLSPGEDGSRLSARSDSVAVEGDSKCDVFAQIPVDPGLLFVVPEPPRSLLLAAGFALLLGLAAGRRHSGLALLLLGIASVGPAARAEVLAATRSLRNVDLDLVAPSSLGTALAGVGDLDGDGVEDLAVGLPDANGGQGRVQIALLRRDGSVDSVVFVGAGLGGFTGSLSSGDAFGTAVASVGDLDGDGIEELAVAAPGSTRVWLLFLERRGPLGPPVFVSDAVAIETTLEVHALAGLGDVDGDTVPDLALGHPFFGGPDCGGATCGAVSILRLLVNGNAKASTLLSATTLGLPDLSPEDHFGAALAGVGDLDANGVPDLAVGIPGHEGERGRVSILFLNFPDPPGTDAESLGFAVLDDETAGFPANSPLFPFEPLDAFGSAIAALGDLDANGSQDLAVGVPGLAGSRGGVVVLTLTSAGALIGPGGVIDASLGSPPEAFEPNGAFGRALASLDVDGDGDREVVVGAARDATSNPNLDEGLAWLLHFSDADGDGRPDVFADNCLGTRNPSQVDTDEDGVGDACDNCVDFDNGPEAGTCTGGHANLLTTSCSADVDCDGGTGLGFCSMDQEDADEDGVGNVCEGVVVRLKGPAHSLGLKAWDLKIDCGRHRVKELAVSLFQPDSSAPLNLDFSGCGVPKAFDPVAGCNFPPGWPGLDVSGVFTSDAVGDYPAAGLTGLRPNTLYAFLYGNPLCDPFEEDIKLALVKEGALGDISNLSIAASQLELAVVPPVPPPPPENGDALITDSGPLPGFCIVDEPENGGQSLVRSAFVTSERGQIDLDVWVAVDQEDPDSHMDWEVCFKTDQYLQRVRLAIEPPSGWNGTASRSFTRDDVEWLGCDSASGMNACTSSYAQSGFRYPINGSSSNVYLPEASSSGDNRDEHLYPVLSGSLPGFSSDIRLNALTNTPPHQSFYHCIGRIRVLGGGSDTLDAPMVFLDGDPYLGTREAFCVDDDWDDSCDEIEGVPSPNVFSSFSSETINTNCTESEDSDADGVRYEADNCPNIANPLQQDSGRLEIEAPDGRDEVGDACQCGEGDGDGIISTLESTLGSGLDLENLRLHLVGGSPEGFDSQRCGVLDASGEASRCNILDAVELQRALEAGAGEILSNRCDAYATPPSESTGG